MNWRNPFLIAYLSVTVGGAAILGYLLYSSWSNAQQVDAEYVEAVQKLQQLQNRVPFPNAENNAKYVEFTKEYRAAYDKLVAKAAGMQKAVEDVTPQAFQDLLRSNVSQVEQAAKENNVKLPEGFYLGFDQYRGTLPTDAAAGPLARELAAIRIVVDQIISLKVREITGIRRDLLSEEGGRPAAVPGGNRPGGNRPGDNRPGGNNRPGNIARPARNIVSADSFEIGFTADQAAARAALNGIANSNQFFIIRNLNVQNEAQDGPEKTDPNAAAQSPPQPGAPAGPEGANRVLAGREYLNVSLRIEMITFNNLPDTK